MVDNKKCIITVIITLTITTLLGCNNCNYSNKNISFHNFPLDPILKANWIEATGVGKGKLC